MSDGETGPADQYLRHLREGRFMLQRSRSSGAHLFYPRIAEPVTGATDLEWVPASGGGTIHAVTIQREKPPAEHGNIVLVDLDEGPRMMSRVTGISPEDIRIGMRVRAQVVPEDPLPHVVFVPEQAA